METNVKDRKGKHMEAAFVIYESPESPVRREREPHCRFIAPETFDILLNRSSVKLEVVDIHAAHEFKGHECGNVTADDDGNHICIVAKKTGPCPVGEEMLNYQNEGGEELRTACVEERPGVGRRKNVINEAAGDEMQTEDVTDSKDDHVEGLRCRRDALQLKLEHVVGRRGGYRAIQRK